MPESDIDWMFEILGTRRPKKSIRRSGWWSTMLSVRASRGKWERVGVHD